jgi:hypothetical protein
MVLLAANLIVRAVPPVAFEKYNPSVTVKGVVVVWINPTMNAAFAAELVFNLTKKNDFLPAVNVKEAMGICIDTMSVVSGVDELVVRTTVPPSAAASAAAPFVLAVTVYLLVTDWVQSKSSKAAWYMNGFGCPYEAKGPKTGSVDTPDVNRTGRGEGAAIQISSRPKGPH